MEVRLMICDLLDDNSRSAIQMKFRGNRGWDLKKRARPNQSRANIVDFALTCTKIFRECLSLRRFRPPVHLDALATMLYRYSGPKPMRLPLGAASWLTSIHIDLQMAPKIGTFFEGFSRSLQHGIRLAKFSVKIYGRTPRVTASDDEIGHEQAFVENVWHRIACLCRVRVSMIAPFDKNVSEWEKDLKKIENIRFRRLRAARMETARRTAKK
ncbi:hypothetical protein K461DRAFT_280452 [Myriangium duriaei CBS 260.36]|uniref:Uncharacterized protein n=1 Tax=Myriangium duriaei CBS 260.36 TaxID=1168546 RepID=A0A9P4IX42_9PEZI|nr:hypothetical protein K461DRAFT_280452 [Myriangium duriaei CBS 260.36]